MQRKGAWGYIMSPVTMVTMATLVRTGGHDVTVLDCPATGDSFSDMLATVARIKPDIVFINTSTPTINDDIYAAKQIKAVCPSPMLTVMFGIHPSSCYADILSPDAGIDFCIIGEPELIALNLAEAIADGTDISSVAGIAFLDAIGRLVVTTPQYLLHDLDALPIPDWSLVDIYNYRLPLNNEPFLLVNTNRGCPFHCTFCNAYVYYGRKPRRRSVEHIMMELSRNVEQFGVRNFMFWAEEFILDRDFVIELCEAIALAGLNIHWVCNSRVDAVDETVLSAIRRAGCWNIAFGIESGNQHVLDLINKQITLAQCTRAVSLAKLAGLQVTGHIIIGFPHDTSETIIATERFVNELDLDFVQYYCAIPYPGTALYKDAVKHGWLTTDEWEQWEHNRSVLSYENLTSEEIIRSRRRMMLRWYFTPKRVINTMKNHIKRPSDLLAFLSHLVGFIRWM